MNNKAKGSNAERELIHMFWNNGFASLRAAGSGSMKYPCPDLIVGNNLRKLAVEVKRPGKKYQHLTKKEIEELRQFSMLFGAEPWVGVRFDRKEWYFVPLQEMKKTPQQNFVLNLNKARMLGLRFDDLISK